LRYVRASDEDGFELAGGVMVEGTITNRVIPFGVGGIEFGSPLVDMFSDSVS
jgi:hypothetical protein